MAWSSVIVSVASTYCVYLTTYLTYLSKYTCIPIYCCSRTRRNEVEGALRILPKGNGGRSSRDV